MKQNIREGDFVWQKKGWRVIGMLKEEERGYAIDVKKEWSSFCARLICSWLRVRTKRDTRFEEEMEERR